MEQLLPILIYGDQFTAVWTASTDGGFTSYEIYVVPHGYSLGPEYLKGTITDIDTTYFTVTGLTAAQGYACTVRRIGTTTNDFVRNMQTCAVAEEVVAQDQTINVGWPSMGRLSSGNLGALVPRALPDGGGVAEFNRGAWRPEEIISGDAAAPFADGGGFRFGFNGHLSSGQDPTKTSALLQSREISQGVFTEHAPVFPSFLCGFSSGGIPNEMADGSVVQAFYGDPDHYKDQTAAGYTQSSFLGRTTDKGVTWVNYATIGQGHADYRYGEPRTCNLGGAVDNEHLVCVIRQNPLPLVAPLAATVYIYVSESFDSGQTWSTPIATNLEQGDNTTAPSWPMYHDGVLYIAHAERNTDDTNEKYHLSTISIVAGATDTDWGTLTTPASWTFDSNNGNPTDHGYGALAVVGTELWYVYYLTYTGLNYGTFTCLRKFDLATLSPIAPTKTTPEVYFNGLGANYMDTFLDGTQTLTYSAYSNRVFSQDGIAYYRGVSDGDAVSVAAIGLTSY